MKDIFKFVDKDKLPQHIAIIMDGNGRWAKSKGLPRIMGHRAGAKVVRDVVQACGELGIEVLTLYAFSTENWSRPKTEIKALMKLLKDYLRKETDELNKNNVKLQAIGRIHELPGFAIEELEKAMEKTSSNTGLILNLALNYSGRAEIIDAVKSIVMDNKKFSSLNEINEETFNSHLYTDKLPYPDLLIRTSGEMRVSNFLLWQIAYAEIWVTDVLWPSFTRQHLFDAIIDFQKRERRFGGIKKC